MTKEISAKVMTCIQEKVLAQLRVPRKIASNTAAPIASRFATQPGSRSTGTVWGVTGDRFDIERDQHHSWSLTLHPRLLVTLDSKRWLPGLLAWRGGGDVGTRCAAYCCMLTLDRLLCPMPAHHSVFPLLGRIFPSCHFLLSRPPSGLAWALNTSLLRLQNFQLPSLCVVGFGEFVGRYRSICSFFPLYSLVRVSFIEEEAILDVPDAFRSTLSSQSSQDSLGHRISNIQMPQAKLRSVSINAVKAFAYQSDFWCPGAYRGKVLSQVESPMSDPAERKSFPPSMVSLLVACFANWKWDVEISLSPAAWAGGCLLSSGVWHWARHAVTWWYQISGESSYL